MYIIKYRVLAGPPKSPLSQSPLSVPVARQPGLDSALWFRPWGSPAVMAGPTNSLAKPGANYCTPERNTSEIVVDFSGIFQWTFMFVISGV